MKTVEVLYFDGCPSHEATVELVRKTIDELAVTATVTETEVTTADEAERLSFPGSPTVRVDGVDIEPRSSDESYGLCCRMYDAPGGRSGVPPVELLKDALT